MSLLMWRAMRGRVMALHDLYPYRGTYRSNFLNNPFI
jgi:hypothetical protein